MKEGIKEAFRELWLEFVDFRRKRGFVGPMTINDFWRWLLTEEN